MSTSLVQVGLRTLRSVAGEDSRLERTIRTRRRDRRARRVTRDRGPGWEQLTGERVVHVRSTDEPGPHRGVFLKGGCDLPALFLMAERLRSLPGATTIYSDGIGISDARADILLQTLGTVPEPARDEICARLGLPEAYFEPTLFGPSFHVDVMADLGSIDKSVVALTIGPNLVRSAYRHRESGLIVDPGGWWLNQSMDTVLGDLSAARWFRDTFEGIGRLTVEDFHESFGRVLQEVRIRTRAQVVVFNTLVVDPGSQAHNYRFLPSSPTLRRRRFALALASLAHELDVHLVDVDRLLKGTGVDSQVDFAHYSTTEQGRIAEAAFGLLDDAGVWN